MSNCSRCRCRPVPTPAAVDRPVLHATSAEPQMRRWPHPIPGPPAIPPEESTMHYIRCALSYQNQLLAEIKTLLEQLVLSEQEKAE